MTISAMQVMDPQDVRERVRAKGTKFATVKFLKKDGSIRAINGHFRAKKHILGNERGQAQAEAMRAKGLIPIYSMADGGWRSFSADRVLEVK